MSAPLTLEGVGRVHGEGHTAVTALADVSLEVGAGETVAVIGPSGSGKSTLLSLAGGLDRPTLGRVLVEGVDLGSLSVAELATLRRQRVGYVFQQYNLIEGLTAAENVGLPLELDGVGRQEVVEAVGSALESMGMANLGDRFPEDLSGGERQRVAIARAVVGDRMIVLADQPTGALDSATGEQVLRMLRRRCEVGIAVVLVTHDPRFAAWADRVMSPPGFGAVFIPWLSGRGEGDCLYGTSIEIFTGVASSSSH